MILHLYVLCAGFAHLCHLWYSLGIVEDKGALKRCGGKITLKYDSHEEQEYSSAAGKC